MLSTTEACLLQLFFIQFNRDFSEQDHKDLLQWFAELTSGKDKVPDGDEEKDDSGKWKGALEKYFFLTQTLLFPCVPNMSMITFQTLVASCDKWKFV